MAPGTSNTSSNRAQVAISCRSEAGTVVTRFFWGRSVHWTDWLNAPTAGVRFRVSMSSSVQQRTCTPRPDVQDRRQLGGWRGHVHCTNARCSGSSVRVRKMHDSTRWNRPVAFLSRSIAPERSLQSPHASRQYEVINRSVERASNCRDRGTSPRARNRASALRSPPPTHPKRIFIACT